MPNLLYIAIQVFLEMIIHEDILQNEAYINRGD